MKKYTLILISFFTCTLVASGQQDSSEVKKGNFTASLVYQSLAHFMGRTDSLSSSVFLPVIGLQAKSGLYIQGAAIFINNTSLHNQLSGGSIEAGLRFKDTKEFGGNIYVSRFLYKESSSLVQSAIQYQTGINTSFKNNVANININGDLKFSNNTDIGLTGGLDHLFIIPLNIARKQVLAINPVANAYFGTQRFITNYTDKIQRDIFGVPVGSATPTNTKKSTSTFNLLAWEYNVNVVLVLGKFNVSISPSYISPQNLVSQNGEYGKDRFYITASVGIRL
jgi:hypothetical protein